MPGINKLKVGYVYVDEASKYNNLLDKVDSSIFFIKDTGLFVGDNIIANYSGSETDPTVPSYVKTITETDISTWNHKVDASLLAEVAFNGDYDYLTNRPTIPSELADLEDDSTHRVVTDASIDNWNSKQDLISDLDNIRSGAVLGASSLLTHQNIKTVNLQTVTGTGNVSVGTITGITMNGQSKGTIGVVDLGTVLTSETDPIYTASVAAGISSTDITNWNNKLTKTLADEYYVTYDYIGSLNDLTASELNTIFS